MQGALYNNPMQRALYQDTWIIPAMKPAMKLTIQGFPTEHWWMLLSVFLYGGIPRLPKTSVHTSSSQALSTRVSLLLALSGSAAVNCNKLWKDVSGHSVVFTVSNSPLSCGVSVLGCTKQSILPAPLPTRNGSDSSKLLGRMVTHRMSIGPPGTLSLPWGR